VTKAWQWILDNKEWLFSGAGLVLVVWIGRLTFRRRKANTSQKIRSGKDSVNIQVGHNMNVRSEETRHDEKGE